MTAQVGSIGIGVGLDLSQLKSDKQEAIGVITKFQKELTKISLRGVIVDKTPFKSVLDYLQAGKSTLTNVFKEWSSAINKTDVNMGKFAAQSKRNTETIIKEWIKLQNRAATFKKAIGESQKDFEGAIGLQKFVAIQKRYVKEGKAAFRELFSLKSGADIHGGKEAAAIKKPTTAAQWLDAESPASRKYLVDKLNEYKQLGVVASSAVSKLLESLDKGDTGVKIRRSQIVKQLDALRSGIITSLKTTKLKIKDHFTDDTGDISKNLEGMTKNIKNVGPKSKEAIGKFRKLVTSGIRMTREEIEQELLKVRTTVEKEGNLEKAFSEFGTKQQRSFAKQRTLEFRERKKQAGDLAKAQNEQAQSQEKLILEETKYRAQIKIGNNVYNARIGLQKTLQALQASGIKTKDLANKIQRNELALWNLNMKQAKDVNAVKAKQIVYIRKLRVEEERLRSVVRAGLGTQQTQIDLGKNLNQQLKAGNGLTREKIREAKKLDTLAKRVASSSDTGFMSGEWIRSRARWFIQLRGFWAIWRGMTNTYEIVRKLEEELANLKAITQSTDAEFLVLKDTMMGIANSIGVPIETLAGGMVKLGQAGLSVEEVSSTIKDVANLSVATMTDMATASDLVTTVMRSWTDEEKNTTRITDILSKTVNKSKATIKGLSQTFQYLTGILPQLNVSFRDTSAMIGIMANKGIKMSKIGTGLRSLMGELVRPSKRFEKELGKIGLTSGEVDASTTDLVTVLERLRSHGFNAADALKGLDRRAASAVSALIKGAHTIRDFSKGLDETGAASRMAAVQMEALNKKVVVMKNNFAELFSNIYDKYKSTLKISVDVLGKMAKGTTDLGKKWKAVLGVVSNTAFAVGTVALFKGLFKIKKLLPGIAPLITRIAAGFKVLFTSPGGWAAIAVITGLTYLITKLSDVIYRFGILQEKVNKARAAVIKANIAYKDLANTFEKHTLAMKAGDMAEVERLEAGNEKLRQLRAEADIHGDINRMKKEELRLAKKLVEEEEIKYKKSLEMQALNLRREVENAAFTGGVTETSQIGNELFSLEKKILSDKDIDKKAEYVKKLFDVIKEETVYSIRFNEDMLNKSTKEIVGNILKKYRIGALQETTKDYKAITKAIEHQLKVLMGVAETERAIRRDKESDVTRQEGFLGEKYLTGKIVSGEAEKEYQKVKDEYKWIQKWEKEHPEWLKRLEKVFAEDANQGSEIVGKLIKIGESGRNEAMSIAVADVASHAKKTKTYKELLLRSYDAAKALDVKLVQDLPSKEKLKKDFKIETLSNFLYKFIALTKEAQLKANTVLGKNLQDLIPKIKKVTWEEFLVEMKKIDTEIEVLGDTQSAVKEKQMKLDVRRMQLQKKYGTLVKDNLKAEEIINRKLLDYAKELTKQYERKAYTEEQNIHSRITALKELNPFEKERTQLQQTYFKEASRMWDEYEPKQATSLLKTLREETDEKEKLINLREKNYKIELAGQEKIFGITKEKRKLELEEPQNKAASLALEEKELIIREEILRNMDTTLLFGMEKVEHAEKLNDILTKQIENYDKQYRLMHPLYNAYKNIEASVKNTNEFLSELYTQTAQTTGTGLTGTIFDLTGGFQTQRQEVVNLKSELKGLAEEYDDAISENNAEQAKEIADNMARLKNEIRDLKNPIKNLGEAFKSLFKDVVDGIRKAIIQFMVMKAITAAMGWLTGGTFTGAEETFSGVPSESPFVIPKANGGILPNIKSFRKFSTGGVVSNPTLAVLGEERKEEIVLPMKNIKRNSASGFIRDTQESVVNVFNVLSENDIAQVMAGTTGGRVIINKIGESLRSGGQLAKQLGRA